MPFVDEILDLYRVHGRKLEVGGLTLADASLQAAHLAEREGAVDTLVAAALLHDIGHLLIARGDVPPPDGDRHDEVGCDWLARYFPESVTEPIRQHVLAKRYLCGRSSHYVTRLSRNSARSLRRQGGVLGPVELERFGASDYFIEALRLRRWIDIARIPGLRRVPDFDHYRALLEGVAGEAEVVTA